jgi:serine/threonine-protein kinase
MGDVFSAENSRTGRLVALKLLRDEARKESLAVERFRREARAAGAISSDYVTQVLDVEEDPAHGIVLVFELLEGESLIERLKRTGPIPYDELHGLVEELWMGLEAAHSVGIVHRDLKPSNVFLERRPSGESRVKIFDFGISKVPKDLGGQTLTDVGQSLGTFSFMPPEQIGKSKLVDHRADIYAVATLIYQSLTGQLPYAAPNIFTMIELKKTTDPRTLAAALGRAVDPRLEAFVARGLAREPDARFPTAADALVAWRELRPGLAQARARSASSTPRPSSPAPALGQTVRMADSPMPRAQSAVDMGRAASAPLSWRPGPPNGAGPPPASGPLRPVDNVDDALGETESSFLQDKTTVYRRPERLAPLEGWRAPSAPSARGGWLVVLGVMVTLVAALAIAVVVAR